MSDDILSYGLSSFRRGTGSQQMPPMLRGPLNIGNTLAGVQSGHLSSVNCLFTNRIDSPKFGNEHILQRFVTQRDPKFQSGFQHHQSNGDTTDRRYTFVTFYPIQNSRCETFIAATKKNHSDTQTPTKTKN